MNWQKVGSRGYLFTFEDPYQTNVYVINGDKHLFICDTFLGTESMEEVLKVLKTEEIENKPIIVFISHADYDHYWGNGAFKEDLIIAHYNCLSRIEQEHNETIEKYSDDKRKTVELVLPTLLFTDKVIFHEDQVEFFFSPGHQIDSSSCYDSKDKVLFVGDNIEDPFPYLNHLNFEDYLAVLDYYLSLPTNFIITGHDNLMTDTTLLEKNRKYLADFIGSTINIEDLSKKELSFHFTSLRKIIDQYKKQNDIRKVKFYCDEILKVLQRLPLTEKREEFRVVYSELLQSLNEN